MANVSIVDYLENKTIMVTGASGFVGKIFVEKILRSQPNVKRLFLLMRASNDKSVEERLRDEVIGNELFDVLRQKHGDGFDAFVTKKVAAVAGDVAYEGLGISYDSLTDLMLDQVNVVVNIAATTKFDERYDVALEINTLGTQRVVDFCKKCGKLEMLLHVSTAYVAGEKSGIISEEPFRMGEALNGGPDLDIDTEVKLAREQVSQLRREGAKKFDERVAMKKLGIERARHFGWPNTYVFTKSMGEMIVGQAKDQLPVAIMRPTIITSTLHEPFPGWLEGNRTIDSFISAYANGNLSFILGDPMLTMDAIPGDMVVNAMLGIMASHQSPCHFIYHVGSSSRNPVKYGLLERCVYQHLCLVKGKNKIKRARFLTSKDRFDFHMKLSYKLPLEILRVVDNVLLNIFQDKYVTLNKKYNYTMRLADLYKPYTFFDGIFDDRNLRRLLSTKMDNHNEAKMFDFDVKNIKWEDYFMRIHVPSVVKYMGK